MGTPLLRLCYYYIGKDKVGQVLNTIIIIIKPFTMVLVPLPYLIAPIAYVPVAFHCTIGVLKAYVWVG
jgi:F0F1-type ATP synthase membrane subunit a